MHLIIYVSLKATVVMYLWRILQVLQEQYGIDVAHKGIELVATLISKVFDSLQTAHKGQVSSMTASITMIYAALLELFPAPIFYIYDDFRPVVVCLSC